MWFKIGSFTFVITVFVSRPEGIFELLVAFIGAILTSVTAILRGVWQFANLFRCGITGCMTETCKEILGKGGPAEAVTEAVEAIGTTAAAVAPTGQ